LEKEREEEEEFSNKEENGFLKIAVWGSLSWRVSSCKRIPGKFVPSTWGIETELAESDDDWEEEEEEERELAVEDEDEEEEEGESGKIAPIS